MPQRALPLLNFQQGSGLLFTKNIYSWISHAKLIKIDEKGQVMFAQGL